MRCHDGQLTSIYRNSLWLMSRPSGENIHIPFFVNVWFSFAIPRLSEGRFAIVTNVGCGMRWTCRRGRRTRPMRTAKSRCPDPPTLGSSFVRRKHEATVARKPGAPRRPRISRKPLRRERRIVSAALSACVRKGALSLHARLAGAASIRHSLRPRFLRAANWAKPGQVMPR